MAADLIEPRPGKLAHTRASEMLAKRVEEEGAGHGPDERVGEAPGGPEQHARSKVQYSDGKHGQTSKQVYADDKQDDAGTVAPVLDDIQRGAKIIALCQRRYGPQRDQSGKKQCRKRWPPQPGNIPLVVGMESLL